MRVTELRDAGNRMKGFAGSDLDSSRRNTSKNVFVPTKFQLKRRTSFRFEAPRYV